MSDPSSLPPVYTRRMLQLHDVTGDENSDPVPDGKVWVVRCITAATGFDIECNIEVANEWATVLSGQLGLVPSTRQITWVGHWVLYAGEHIFVNVAGLPFAGSSVDFTASGYELSAPQSSP